MPKAKDLENQEVHKILHLISERSPSQNNPIAYLHLFGSFTFGYSKSN